MELHPLDPLGLNRPDPVDAGWARRIRHGPMTIDQVLARGLSDMLDEDEAERRRADPFTFVTGPRRRSLWARLTGR